MKNKEAFDIFYNALFEAASNIDKQYYRVKLAYFNQTIYRENVYCYELYYQLRKILGDSFPYTLSGEIDKASHPDVVNHCLEFKSNFLIHQPGVNSPDSNLCILQVTDIQNAFRYHETFIDKLMKMNCATNFKEGYYRGIMLIYGDEQAELDRGIYDLYKNYCRGLYDKIYLLYHNAIGLKPEKIIIK